MGKYRNLTGMRFERLIVLKDTGKRNNSKRVIYLCKCDCGREIETTGFNLLRGDTKSCGCLKIDKITKHGYYKTKLYKIWADMLSRCKNKKCVNYKSYGAKGVRVTKEWNNFIPFKNWALSASYKKGLSIDRIDPYGNYEPSNCRWVTRKMQDRNKRNSLFVEIKGTKIDLQDLSEQSNLSYSLLKYRYHLGIKNENILIPPQRGKKLEQI
ncbi:hypothetical protein [Clostridium tyrobutyricum]|uniref:hypothetical protein n=1 Tax=Clostridium tyrobutyricum TaxID=1519 RepID=UPI00069088A3|nr:hypothetical protein [Clostridium tyrobutyricum]